MGHKLLVNHQISPAIVDLILEARQRVDLVSPYLEPWTHLMQQIDTADKRGVKISMYFRHDKIEAYRELCADLTRFGVDLYAVQFLHSKIYANEGSCILTSMNLVDFSASNSEEFGLRIDESALVAEVNRYIADLKSRAFQIRKSVFGDLVKSGAKTIASKVSDILAPSGHCIRCNAPIELDPNRPLCPKCFSAWNKYQDPTYGEKVCHACGKQWSTSMAKPLCKSCYPKFAR